jgi:hypothetical protein
MSKLLCGIACLFLSAAAYADDQVIEKPLVAQSLAGFDQEATEIRAGMHEGGRYEFLKADDKSKVEARLNSMHALLEKHASQNELNSGDKIALVNAQEEVNAILKHNDSNRLVCESRAPIGSHLPVKTCRTYGDIEMQRQDAMKTRSDLDKSRVNKGGG